MLSIDTGTTEVIIAFGAMIGGFYSIARLMLSQASKDRESDRKERNQLSGAIKLMAKNTEKVAVATLKSANEAKERNGHLGEQNVKIAELVAQGNETSVEILHLQQKSAEVLVKDTKDAAAHVQEVKLDLATNVPLEVKPSNIDNQTN